MMPGPVFGGDLFAHSSPPRPHLRSISPVTRPIITSSLPPHRGRTRLTPTSTSPLVSALFYRSRGVYVDGAGSAQLLSMPAICRSPSTLRFAPHARLTTQSCAVTKIASSNGPIPAVPESNRRDICTCSPPAHEVPDLEFSGAAELSHQRYTRCPHDTLEWLLP